MNILKKYAELFFQVVWCREFRKNKELVLEYWKKYRFLNEIKRICKINKNTKILDVGCGISSILHFIDGKKYGIDPLASMYKRLYSYPNDIDIRTATAEEIPFDNEFFDVVFCSNVLDHVTNPNKSVNEIHRVLKNNGYFVLTVEIFDKRIKRDIAHPFSFTKDDIHSLLKRYKILFEKESVWIGLRNYVKGRKTSNSKELIVVAKKI